MDMYDRLGRNEVRGRILCATLIALPILCALQMMRTHWVAVPWWDEWLTPGETLASYYRGTLTFADLWSQHNESRKFVPRLLYLALYVPCGWDVRYGMVLGFAWVCVGSAGLYWVLSQSVSRSIACGGFVLMNVLLFSPRQYENFLYSLEGENFTPAFALIFALGCNLRVKSFRTKAIINSFLALFSTYTFANGMLVWLLAFPVQWKGAPAIESSAGRRFWRIAYSLAALVSIGAYFVGYQRPEETPPFATNISTLWDLLHYLLIWLGSLFVTPVPTTVGVCILGTFTCLVVMTSKHARQVASWRVPYPWLILGSYVLISGLVTAAGRVGFGLTAAPSVRYTVFTVFFYIAVLGLFCSIYQDARRSIYKRPVMMGSAALLLVLWAFTLRYEIPLLAENTAAREHLQLVARWSLAIPANPDLRLLSPYRETLWRIRVLAAHDALRPRLIDARLAQGVTVPSAPTSKDAGYLDQVVFNSRDRLLAQGWAQIPGRDTAADCVVLGYRDESGSWNLFGVTETGGRRPDVAAALRIPGLMSAGFSRFFTIDKFPRGSVIFEARAIDLKHKRLFPMSGAAIVARPRG